MESAEPVERRHIPSPYQARFRMDDLRTLRLAVGQWARQAGLAGQRSEDFVLAVNEIATNAVRHGSPAAVLRLRAGQAAVTAEVRDSGRWVPGPGEKGGMGLPLVYRVCDQVEVQADGTGTTVTLRMSLP